LSFWSNLVAKRIHSSVSSSAVILSLLFLPFAALGQKPILQSGTRFGASHSVPQTQHGPVALLQRLSQGSPAALSVTAADFYEDSTRSLVTGFALGNGGVISLQDGVKVLPRVEEMAAKAAFQLDAAYIDVGIRPDFLKSADVNGDAHQDLIVASRGGSSIEILLGDGRGNFTPQAPIQVKGEIAALTPLRSATGQRLIAAGVCGESCSVDLYQFNGTRVASVPVDDRISILEAARFNGTPSDDLIAGGSSQLVLIDGKSALTSAPRVDRLPVSGAISVATGNFVYDTHGWRQIAVLTNDGTLHTLARAGLIGQPPVLSADGRRSHRRNPIAHPAPVDPSTLRWVEVEALGNIAQFNAEGTPTLLWSRVAGSGMDNVLLLNVNGGAITTVLHQVVLYPSTGPGMPSSMKALPARVEIEPSSSGPIAGAIALRTAQDSRFGLVMARSKPAPEYRELTANRTITVNASADVGSGGVTTGNMNSCKNGTSGCTLRAALAVADADASSNEADGTADTVNLPAGTYTLLNDGPETPNSGLVGQTDDYGNVQYHIEIYGPTNLIGTAGASDTIVSTGNKDKIFSENSANQLADPNSFQPPIDFYLSGVTLDHGENADATYAEVQQNGNLDFNGGLMDSDTGAYGYITLVDDIFANGTAPGGPGGGVFTGDDIIGQGSSGTYVTGNGVLEIDNCTFSGNISEESGGALSVGYYVPMILSGDTFSGNGIPKSSAEQQDAAASGEGGAVEFTTDSTVGNAPETTIANSTFNGNYGTHSGSAGSPSNGGGVYAANAIEITNSVFTNNKAGDGGGGIFMSTDDYTSGGAVFAASIVGNVLIDNTATYGGAINLISELTGAANTTGTTATVQYNTIYGNSGNGNTSGIALGNFNNTAEHYQNAAVTATDNFWGCNTGPNTTGCDSAQVEGTQGGTLTVSPYAVVTAALSAASVPENSQITLTGYLDSDSNGTAIGNLSGFTGLSAGLQISLGGSPIASSNASTDSAASASLSATPSGSGSGYATFTIDNATVTEDFTVTPPAPSANNQSVSVAYDSSVGITLTASGQGTITYSVTSSPSHGVLSGTAPNLTYQAHVGYVGSDSFQFTASNGTTSPAATVSITVDKIQPGLSLSAPATANRGTASPLVATFTGPVGAPYPTSLVSFYSDGSNLLGTAPIIPASPNTFTATLYADLPAGQQTLTATYPGDSSYLPASSAGESTFVIANYIWVGNSNGTTSAFDPVGTPYLSTAEPDGGYGVAIDSSGNIWSVNSSSSSVAEFSETGSVISAGYTGAGLSTPAAVAIDGSNRIWVTNFNNSVSVLNSYGQPVSSSAYTGTIPDSAAPLNAPAAISIDVSGNVWIANSGNGTVAELLGAATPTIPLSSGVSGSNPAPKP
jgi:hypothetical protein